MRARVKKQFTQTAHYHARFTRIGHEPSVDEIFTVWKDALAFCRVNAEAFMGQLRHNEQPYAFKYKQVILRGISAYTIVSKGVSYEYRVQRCVGCEAVD